MIIPLEQPTTPPAPVQALIVVDVQVAFVTGEGAVPDAARVLDRTGLLLQAARAAGALVVHLQNDGPPGADDETGTPGWELRFPPVEGELVLRKTVDDGFEEYPLAERLKEAGVRSLVLCGVQSEMCVSATARTALESGFRVVLPHDAHATYGIPAAPGISEAVPAAMVSRVAEWALGDEVEVVAAAEGVTFEPNP
ncbi:isochorismatase family protein [Streptomyces sp. NBC_00237]|uniref:isochorismatase family protein n=1 Tax=Streptomyces sp. NBC_00237 TaxID=2975687 RepID=UPI0022542424|nr:isochorismatase family protein [Streptomyces sp. NBC_00237]MCX5205155.1 isochorismatase family protein [Streptomyces sp. NBC_00237]